MHEGIQIDGAYIFIYLEAIGNGPTRKRKIVLRGIYISIQFHNVGRKWEMETSGLYGNYFATNRSASDSL